MARRSGAEALCDALAAGGVEHVFGLPGTQSIDLWEALRTRGAPRPVVATNELAAAFMANGYARATGRPGVVVTIPGPGFTYALTGLAEALLDSVPLVHLVGAPARRADGAAALQAIRQVEIAAPLVKRVLEVASADEVPAAVDEALRLALAGEPGPVLLQVDEAVLRATTRNEVAAPVAGESPLDPVAAEALERIAAARRPVFLCGQGAAGAAAQIRGLAEQLRAPILTTTSGRGVLPETHPSSLAFDSPGASIAVVNELLASADAIAVLGAKLSHNGAHGFALRLPPERLIRVDTSRDVLAAGYPAALAVEADVGRFLGGFDGSASAWTEPEIATWRDRFAGAAALPDEQLLAGASAAKLFGALRRALPDTTVVASDSGIHQYLLRRHFPVLAPRTLLVPTDFQSMGFGLPAAIGAALATRAPAVAVIGDGGFALGGLELSTAVKEGVTLVVTVLVDGSFGLIRRQQLRRTGHASGVDLPRVDPRLVAAAVGARHELLEDGDAEPVFARALEAGGVTVVEVPVVTNEGAGAEARRLAVASARRLLGATTLERLAARARMRG